MATKKLEVLLTGRDQGAGRAMSGVGKDADKLDRKLRDLGKGVDGDQIGQGIGQDIGGGVDAGFDPGGSGGMSSKLASLGGMLAGGALAAGAVIGGAIVVGITGAMDMQAGRGMLQAQLGLSESEAAEAGRVAGQVYAGNFGDSMGHAQEAVDAVMSSIGDDLGAGGLQAATEQALTFSQVMGTDVSTAANTAGIAIESGLATDATHAFDLMTAASQQMPAAMRGELIPAIDEYGQYLSAMGITGEDAFGLLASASQDGMYGIDKTGDAIKELTIRATDMSTGSVAAFDSMGLNAEEMAGKILAGGDSAREGFDQIVDGLLGIQDPTEQANAAIALFGTPLEDLGTSEIPAFLSSLDTMGDSLGDVSGATTEAADAVAQGLGPALEEGKRKAEVALGSFFDGGFAALQSGGLSGLGDYLGGVWDQAFPVMQAKASELMTKAGEWLRDEGPGVAQAVGDAIRQGAGAILGAWPDYVRFMGNLWSRVGAWIMDVGFPMLGDFLMGLGPALWQWIQDAYPGFVRAMAGLWASLGGWILEAVPMILAKGAELWAAMFEWLWTEAIPTVLRGLGNLLAGIAGWLLGTAIPWLQANAGTWWGVLVSTVQEKGLAVLAWLGTLPGLIRSWIIGTALPFLRDNAAVWFLALREKAMEKGLEALAWLQTLPGTIGSWIVGTALPALRAKAGEWFATLKEKATEKGLEAIAWLQTLPGTISTWITGTAIPALRTKAAEWFAVLKDKAEEKGEELLDWARDLPGEIVSAIGDLGNTLLQVGRDLVQGLLDGIQEKVGAIAGSITNPIQGAIDTVRGMLQTNSPSKVFMEIGRSIPDGMTVGIGDGERDVWDRLGNLTRGLAPQADGDLASPGRSSALAGGGGPVAPIEVTVISVLDGREVGRSRTLLDSLSLQVARGHSGRV